MRVEAAAQVHLDVERLAAGDEAARAHERGARRCRGRRSRSRRPRALGVVSEQRLSITLLPVIQTSAICAAWEPTARKIETIEPGPVRPQEGEQAEEDRSVSLRLDHLRNLAVARDTAECAEIEETSRVSMPETRYAKSDGRQRRLSGRRRGSVRPRSRSGLVSHVEIGWNVPSHARLLRGLAEFSRLIIFDKRGTGMSDRLSES